MADKILFRREIVFSNKFFIVEQDWEVPIIGFFVILSKRKARSILDFNSKEVVEFGKLVKFLRVGMKNVLNIREVCLFQDEGAKYFHLWVFPRYSWMNKKFGGRIESIRPIMDWAKKNMSDDKTTLAVREAVKNLRNYMDSHTNL